MSDVGAGLPALMPSGLRPLARWMYGEQCRLTHRPRFSGYTRPFGEKTQGEANTREMLDIWPEVPALSPEELEGKPAYYRLPGPNQWPERVPALKGIVEEWQRVVGNAAHLLLRAWARSLGQEDDYFDRHFENPTTRMKIVRYPPSEVKAGEDGPLGVGAHKDGGCVTLLWVQPGVGGLQVWRDGAWADVAPAPEDGFVCNIGEMVELATDGYLKATVHRVVPGEERISVPMFFNPSLDARLPKITLPEKFRKEIEREEGERKVDTTHDDQIFETYGDNLLKSRLRSHTDVAERWYADLLAARQVSA